MMSDEVDNLIAMAQEVSETLRMDIRRADEAVAKLRKTRKDIQQLLDTEIPRIVAEAVALHISKDNTVNGRGGNRVQANGL